MFQRFRRRGERADVSAPANAIGSPAARAHWDDLKVHRDMRLFAEIK